MINILIAESDRRVAEMLRISLFRTVYNNHLCHDVKGLDEAVGNNDFDVILLDTKLIKSEECKSFDIIKRKAVPTIFLAEMSDVTGYIGESQYETEDYIVKPFDPLELKARIEVALRKNNKGMNRIIYEEIIIDLDKRSLTKEGIEVLLTPMEFDVLVYFMQNMDIAITRDKLLSAVWGYEFGGESRTVDIHVQRVRKKVGLDGRLLTVPKLGYRLLRK